MDDSRQSAMILRIAIIIATLFFILLTFLYCYAQLTELDVSNLWCQNKYTLNEIREHSQKNNLPFGDSESCYIITDNPVLNYYNLKTVNGIYGSSFNVTGFFCFCFVCKWCCVCLCVCFGNVCVFVFLCVLA